MDCRAYCTATSYQIKNLFDTFKDSHQPVQYRDAVHIRVRTDDAFGDIFYFSYGVMVSWGLSPEIDSLYLSKVESVAKLADDEIDMDEFTFSKGGPKIIEDEIFLPEDTVFERLAVSHGLAQSVKLGTFESSLRKILEATREIPEDLAKYGRIALSRKEIRKKMGELFIERNSINLHTNVLDTPDFFWEHSELEPLYRMTVHYLDVKQREEVLNQRLGVIHELFEMLGNELNHQHSSRLEWTIICLIVIEVFMTLLKDVFGIL
jgi:uncharacterized Rmd1/YagE family protein